MTCTSAIDEQWHAHVSRFGKQLRLPSRGGSRSSGAPAEYGL